MEVPAFSPCPQLQLLVKALMGWNGETDARALRYLAAGGGPETFTKQALDSVDAHGRVRAIARPPGHAPDDVALESDVFRLLLKTREGRQRLADVSPGQRGTNRRSVSFFPASDAWIRAEPVLRLLAAMDGAEVASFVWSRLLCADLRHSVRTAAAEVVLRMYPTLPSAPLLAMAVGERMPADATEDIGGFRSVVSEACTLAQGITHAGAGVVPWRQRRGSEHPLHLGLLPAAAAAAARAFVQAANALIPTAARAMGTVLATDKRTAEGRRRARPRSAAHVCERRAAPGVDDGGRLPRAPRGAPFAARAARGGGCARAVPQGRAGEPRGRRRPPPVADPVRTRIPAADGLCHVHGHGHACMHA